MTAFATGALWCEIQAAIVAALGLAAIWRWSGRSPGAAAIAAAGAAATILAVTLQAPLPWPKLARGLAPAPAQAPLVMDDVVAPTYVRDGSRSPDSASQNGFAADAGGMLRAAWGAVRAAGAARPQAKNGAVAAGIAGAVILGAAIGLYRLAVAWRYMARLRRQGTLISDAAAERLVADLSRRLGVRRPIALIQSSMSDGPATMGWRRPVVLLPLAWSTWSAQQLRAALAHELAHVVRGDFAWRMATSAALALHFFHPLVHWLTRRLALAQELAADKLAAAAVGGLTTYLRAVSELALRLDDSVGRHAAPLALPAFSSNLMRRIAMLRSKDGQAETRRHRAYGVAAAGLIALVGAATMVLGRAAETAPTPSAPSSLFARQALDDTLVGHAEQGLFVVRVDELSQRAAWAPMIQLMNHEIGQAWPRFFDAVPSPDIHFEAIEYVAGSPSLVLRPKTGDSDEQMGRLMVWAGEVVVRFRSDVDWQAWIKTYVPGAEAATTDGFAYVKLPVIPAMGPQAYLVAARDSRTLVGTGNLERLKVLAAGEDPKPAGLASTWATLDGGLATALFAAPEIDGDAGAFANDEDAAGEASADEAKAVMRGGNVVLRAIGANVRQIGLGFDMDPTTNLAALRMRLVCSDNSSAERIRTALNAFLPVAKLGLAASRNAGPQANADETIHAGITPENEKFHREGHDFWLGLLESCRTECESQEDGASHVCITATAPFESHLVHAQQIAERADATDDPTRR